MAPISGRNIRNAQRRNPRDPGADKERGRLERKHGRAIRKAFAKVQAIVVPARSTAQSLTVEGAIGRLHDRQGIIRDALMAMLTDAILLGAAHGWDDVEQAMGIRTNAVLGITWDLIHAAALQWVLTGNGPAGLPEWGTGYGGVNSLTAQIVRTSETQLRSLIAEWIENWEALPSLINRMEAVTFSRRRAELIAVTEVTRAYALGNILSWQESGVIRRHRWETARDEIVCPYCRPLQGAIAPVGQSFRLPDGRLYGPPPAHPACRCWLTAVVEYEP